MILKCVLLAFTLIAAPYPEEFDNANPAVKEFKKRVDEYWDLHKKVEADAPPINKKKEDPADLVEHEHAVFNGIKAARKGAPEGAIFTPAVQKVIVAVIKQQLSSGKGAEARKMILGDGNPRSPESPARVELVVNGKYPPSAPLSTVPPSVLLSLPKLPEGLEYRFVGRHLILYDSKANLIVDILRNAIR